MNFKTLLSVIVLVTISTCSYAIAEKLTPKTLTKLQQQLLENKKRYGTVSQSILVKKQDEVIYRDTVGMSSLELSVPIKENNIYPMYSITKLFTSISLMTLVEKGEVDLDKSITFYLPQLPDSWSHVTVRHCLNHTSGIPEYFSMEMVKTGYPNSVENVFLNIADHPFQFKTGEKNKYNNTNFLVIGSIIEKITQQSYLNIVKEKILTPLALKHTVFSKAKEVIPNLASSYWGNNGSHTVDKGIDWPTYSFTHSGLYSSKADLQRFIEGVVDGKIISKETLYEMWQPMKLNNGQEGRYASGWDYYKEGEYIRVGHEGGNRVRLDYHYKPSNKNENYTSIYLTNGNAFAEGITTHLVDGLMSIISPNDFPTLVLQEKLLDGAFNKTLSKQSKSLFNEITNSPYISDSEVAEFITERGYTLYSASDSKNAIPLFEFYTENFPDDAKGWDRLGQSWLAAKDKKQAIKFFEKALSIDGQLTHTKSRLEKLQKHN